MFVYQITNKINGKKYIGQHAGVDLKKYWQHNVYRAIAGFRGKPALYRAICKYGSENFDKLMAAHIGAKRSDEARQRMSDAHKGKKASEETKQRMRDAQQRRREK